MFKFGCLTSLIFVLVLYHQQYIYFPNLKTWLMGHANIPKFIGSRNTTLTFIYIFLYFDMFVWEFGTMTLAHTDVFFC